MKYDEIVFRNDYSDISPVIFGSEKCEPGHDYGPCVRTYWLLHYIHEGCGTFFRDNKVYRVKSDEIFVIPPYKETYYKADPENPWHYTWIGFRTDRELPPAFSNAVIRCSSAKIIFKKMHNCTLFENGRAAFLCSCLWELISILLNDEGTHLSYADKAKDIIENEFSEDITVSDIADRLNVNRSYLFSIFKEETGLSPQQYLIDFRLKKAAEFMTVYNQSVTISAYSSGYKDIYSFSKIFKKHFGVSPKEYCKIMKENGRKK